MSSLVDEKNEYYDQKSGYQDPVDYQDYGPNQYNKHANYENADDIICDDSKRVTIEGTNSTYHVDCDGFDMDGALILIGLDDCEWRNYTDDTNLTPSWGLKNLLNDDLVTAVTCSDFFHCSRCFKCRPFNLTSVRVSVEFSFHFFIYFEYSATRTKLLIFQCIRC